MFLSFFTPLLPPPSIPSPFSLSSPTPLLLQVIRTTGLRALHGLFSSVAGPQGLTALLNGQLISVSTVSSSLTPLSSHSSHPLLSFSPLFFPLLSSLGPLSIPFSFPLLPFLFSLSFSLSLSLQALYDYQPSLVDSQMLQAWLTVMQSAHTRLSR